MTFHTVFNFPPKKEDTSSDFGHVTLEQTMLIYRRFIVSNTVDTDFSDVHKMDDLM